MIKYLEEKYSENRVCQIINFSYITPVVAIKDVGKVLGFKYTDMDKISKQFTGSTFQECLDKNKDLVAKHPEYKELFDIAGHLSGRIKTVSCHAGGVGIVDTDIDDYMPMKLGTKGEHVIQCDKRLVEEIGIIKFDILGVQTLTLVKEIQDDLGLSDYEISINNPDFENEQSAYEILKTANTNGVFQVESQGMKELLVRLQPSCMDDLSAVLALYRPDTMGAMEQFIENKHHPEKITYIHPDMKPILRNSYGCLIYQEQILDIVRKFGGRSYGGADLFRKAIGKKNADLVRKESEKLYQEIIDNGYSEDIAKKISDELAEKGGYCFNKSHSYCYAVLCFQTAYLKAEYPVYFFKALLNLNKSDTGKLNKYIIEAKKNGVEVLSPSINHSDVDFSVYNGKILFGLSAIAGIGETAAKTILEERAANGKFKGFDDFCGRISPTKTQVINLVKSGAIPTRDKREFLERYFSLKDKKEYKPVEKLPSKAVLRKNGINPDEYGYTEEILAAYNKVHKEKFDEKERDRQAKELEKNSKYLENEKFWEFEALSIFINDNPFEKALQYIDNNWDSAEIGDKCVIVGIISDVQKKTDKRKKRFAFINIYTPFGIIEAVLWSSIYAKYEELVKKGTQIVAVCNKEAEDKLTITELKTFNEWLRDREIEV